MWNSNLHFNLFLYIKHNIENNIIETFKIKFKECFGRAIIMALQLHEKGTSETKRNETKGERTTGERSRKRIERGGITIAECEWFRECLSLSPSHTVAEECREEKRKES